MDAITILRTLIGFDTTSRNPNLALTDWMADYLDGLGARLRLSFNEDRSKANVLASFGPDRDGGVVLSGHTDVVRSMASLGASIPSPSPNATGASTAAAPLT